MYNYFIFVELHEDYEIRNKEENRSRRTLVFPKYFLFRRLVSSRLKFKTKQVNDR